MSIRSHQKSEPGRTDANPSPACEPDRLIVVDDRDRIASSPLKRTIDIIGAAAALLLSGPVLVLALVVTRSTSGPPALFRQERVGRDGRSFTILKIRTMRVDNSDAEHRAHSTRLLEDADAGPGDDGSYKLRDPRVTAVGRVLRALSIDELPQLVNVIRGDMSLVGPRPMLPWEHDLLSTRHRQRVLAKPGMSGLWQVSGRSQLSVHEMLDLDLEYLEEWSVWCDVKILLRTPFALLSR